MNLLQIDPVREVKGMAHEIAHRMGHLFSRIKNRKHIPDAARAPDWLLSVDISETDTEYLISGDIPGVNKDEVRISFRNGMLTIQGERKAAREGEGRNFHRMECPHGYFMRSFRMPDDTDEKTVKVEFGNGLFSLTLPKSAKPKDGNSIAG